MKLYIKEGISSSCVYCNGVMLNIVITSMLVSLFDLCSNCIMYAWNFSHLRKTFLSRVPPGVKFVTFHWIFFCLLMKDS